VISRNGLQQSNYGNKSMKKYMLNNIIINGNWLARYNYFNIIFLSGIVNTKYRILLWINHNCVL
jgi:hypothetical protein